MPSAWCSRARASTATTAAPASPPRPRGVQVGLEVRLLVEELRVVQHEVEHRLQVLHDLQHQVQRRLTLLGEARLPPAPSLWRSSVTFSRSVDNWLSDHLRGWRSASSCRPMCRHRTRCYVCGCRSIAHTRDRYCDTAIGMRSRRGHRHAPHTAAAGGLVLGGRRERPARPAGPTDPSGEPDNPRTSSCGLC